MGWIVLVYTLDVVRWLIIASVILSWVAPHSRHPVAEALRRATDAILEPVRRVMPRTGPVDLSPLVVLFLVIVVQRIIAMQLT